MQELAWYEDLDNYKNKKSTMCLSILDSYHSIL